MSPPEPSTGFLSRVFQRIGAAFRRLLGRLRFRRMRLRAEARLIEAEFLRLGAKIWENIDALRLTTERFRLTPIRTQFYGHGAFMGAAPSLLSDPTWKRILGFLMPDVFEQVRVAIEGGAGPAKLIGMLENNPVLAAYGVHRAASGRRAEDANNPNHLVGIEWDVFVDSAVVEGWEKAKDDKTRARWIARALDTSLIAHAAPTDTLQEAMGLSQYADVRNTPKTELGGVELDAWLDYFGRALELGAAKDLDAAVAAMSKDARKATDEECARETFEKPWPIPRVVEAHRAVTGKEALSIIIEIKSLRSTARFLGEIVRALNEKGVHVAAVASFIREEVRGIGAREQHVGGRTLPGPREIQFFHFAGDMQRACDDGEIEKGQSILFNGASLIESVGDEGKKGAYATKRAIVEDLGRYRERFDLHLGLYVQEGDCDHEAASLLAELVEEHAGTFDLGFAWGGLRDEAHLPASDDVRLGYGSQRVLEYVGKAKQWELRAPSE